MRSRTRASMRGGLCCLLGLSLAGARLQGQSTGAPGPLHVRSESQELADLTAAPDAVNQKVANANSLVGLAVDPSNGKNVVVVSNSAFYLSSDGGSHWNTDYVPYLGVFGYTDPFDTTADLSQYPLGIAFDRKGNTYTGLDDPSGLNDGGSGNVLAVAEGSNHGGTVNNVPQVAVTADCGNGASGGSCDENLTGLGIMTDQSGTPSDGVIYLYYLYTCESPVAGCESGTLYQGDSFLEVQTSGGPGLPFDGGSLISNYAKYTRIGGASGVVDGGGTPRFVFTDFGEMPTVDLILGYASTPLLQYTQVGFQGTQTGIRSATPTCAAHGETGYCVFNAASLGPGAPQAFGNIYLAIIDFQAGTATAVLVNNDPPGQGKDHFNPAVTVTPNGDVYVGWFDDRRDPADKKLDYFLARSTDGGKSFPMQQAINEVSFTALLGTPPFTTAPRFAGFLGSGPDGVVHAAWTDTRDGLSVQIYSRSVQW